MIYMIELELPHMNLTHIIECLSSRFWRPANCFFTVKDALSQMYIIVVFIYAAFEKT